MSSPVGVCLSGGGHRATTWALGILLHVRDSKLGEEVTSISSVSGGSIANGWIATRGDFRTQSPKEIERAVRELASRVATRGTVFADEAAGRIKTTIEDGGKVLLVVAALALVAGFAGSVAYWVHPAWAAPLLGFAGGPGLLLFAIVLGWLAVALHQRGRVTRDGYANELYGQRRLDAIESGVEHVFCTTDLQSAEHVYWSQRFVYNYRFGVAAPGPVRVADAVAASAAFPGAFPPVVVPFSDVPFAHGAESELPPHVDGLVLLDGGIYDNLGEQWFVGAHKRLVGDDPDPNARARAAALARVVAPPPARLVVANASAAYPFESLPKSWLPFEGTALYRMVLALDDNAASVRQQRLVDGFRRPSKPEEPSFEGILVHIGTDPVRAVKRGPEERQEACRALLAAPLGASGTTVDWRALMERNKKVSTTLDPLGVEVVADLLQHAYVLAAVQAHLYLSEPLPPREIWIERFGRDRFLRLATA